MLVKFYKSNIKKTIACLGLISLLSQFGVIFPSKLESANLTTVKDALESSRLSFHAANDAGTGGTVVKIKTALGCGGADCPNQDTTNLFPGDVIEYFSTGNTRTVETIIDSTTFTVSTALDANDDDEDDQFMVRRTSQHVITFKPSSVIADGFIRVKVKAGASNNADDDPDRDGFDFYDIDQTGVDQSDDVACSGGAIDFTWTTATPSAGHANCPAGYHCFECRYSGSTDTATEYTMTIGGSANTAELVNPSNASTHTEGTADTYQYTVEHLDSSYTLIDDSSGKVALVESVRVTATVDPTITFSIAGVDAATIVSNDICGINTNFSSDTHNDDTTAFTVPFGSLVLGEFNDAAQQISCITNAAGGYVITVSENDQLTMVGGAETLADTDCDAGDCTNATSTAGDWATEKNASGFGFTMENVNADEVAFEYNSTTCTSGDGNIGSMTCACDGVYCAIPFPSDAVPETPVSIMRNTSTPSTTESAYVCYRIAIGTTQQPGDYSNYVTYRATATF